MPDSPESRDWWKSQLTISLVLQLLITGGGWVVGLSTMKASLENLDRRVVVLENEIVPRHEHEASQRIEEQKDKLLDERLNNIERMLTQSLEQQSRRN